MKPAVLPLAMTLFGWTEPIWSVEARQVLAVEILTLVGLAALAVVTVDRRVRFVNARG